MPPGGKRQRQLARLRALFANGRASTARRGKPRTYFIDRDAPSPPNVTLARVQFLERSPLPLSDRERSLLKAKWTPEPAARRAAPVAAPAATPPPSEVPTMTASVTPIRSFHTTRYIANPHDPLDANPEAEQRAECEERERQEQFDASTVAAGQSAWNRLKSSKTALSDHRLVGQALLVGRRVCMAKCNTGKPRGIKYVQEFGRWLNEKGFGDLQKTRRQTSMLVAENWAEIQLAMKTLSAARRSEINDCTVAWRLFKTRNRPPHSNNGKDGGWRHRKSIDVTRAKEAIEAVRREAPELDAEACKRVAYAVMRALSISVPAELFRASAMAEVPAEACT
jgi:hypothetical protein